ncbi:DNA adenine methylase [Streptomyces malaysiensis subsp. malaysiensis]|uniref:site-specific DNA-methyltransferase (adenine-specific) n=1 Tax=Streptomyces malaysiensis TaxID=92644 RepID=A0ABX6WC10_STRMQ|nr:MULTISPECIES: DNA adenine methylase [Streptomyces]QPI58189.1 DNA adenine methylase [Streptomyces solisilvae]UHH19771.1 DNA adenine methylase [Streptomyces sp. HNM0561]
MAASTLGPPFPYYGSKARLAQWILPFIPDHKNYIEPFAGSASVLMAKEPCRVEILNDLDGEVVNFWRILRDHPDELIGLLQLTPYARDEFLDARQVETDHSDVERARRFLVRYVMAFNSTVDTKSGFSRTSSGSGSRKTHAFIRRVDERLALVAHRIRSVEIENMDALKLIDAWRTPDTVLYLDPPYLRSTRTGRGGYVVESDTDEFHQRLIDTIADFPGTVLLSGYRGGPYERLDWHCEERNVHNGASTTDRSSRRVESLWMNRPPADLMAG